MSARIFKPGDIISLKECPVFRFYFRDYGHACVIARHVEPVPGYPLDVIARQKDFVLVEHATRKEAA